MKKVTLHTKKGMQVELGADRVATNEVELPGETEHGFYKLWVIGNEYGALGAVWSVHWEDAFDELVDQGLGAGLLVDEAYVASLTDAERDDLMVLGNASEYADLTNAWVDQVVWELPRDWHLLAKLAEARGAGADSLEGVL